MNATVTILTWSAPRWAWLLGVFALLLIGAALAIRLAHRLELERDAEREWCACGYPDYPDWHHSELGCWARDRDYPLDHHVYDQDGRHLCCELERLADEQRWQRDLDEIHADERAIESWLAAGCPADREPYAISRYAVAA